ncbi:MAG TPA: O-methyltransferase [Vicinamibacterales bacterium]|nr:O-methyltransferase [Vicinamibacterales bacterium]
MGQVVPDAIERYLASLHGPVDDVLEAVEAEGRAAGLPLVQAPSGRFLRALALITGAKNILEIGTAIGYSAIWMAGALPADGRLITLERDAARAETARANLARAGLGGRVSVIVGDAARYLHKIAGPFDLIFQDGDKLQYEPMLDRLVGLLRVGGVLVSDNVLWNGEVVEGYVDNPQRNASDTEALRTYNRRLVSDPRLFTTILPVGDGLAVSVKVADTRS